MTIPSGMQLAPMSETPVKHQPIAVSNSDITGPLGNEASPSKSILAYPWAIQRPGQAGDEFTL